jgi:hypothetical protein
MEFDFSWLVGRRVIVSLAEPATWVFGLGESCAICAWCPWRLLQRGRIEVSNEDHGQRYGRQNDIDAAALASSLLQGAGVTRVEVREGTADLILHFEDGRRLELLPFSSGYESWSVSGPAGTRVVAQGGGALCTW